MILWLSGLMITVNRIREVGAAKADEDEVTQSRCQLPEPELLTLRFHIHIYL